MKKIKKDILTAVRDELQLLFYIGVGVFLFILFFQPFPLNSLDYNDRLLFITGLAGISFISSCLILVLLPLLLPKWFRISDWESGPPFSLYFFLLLLTSTAFIFYISYVGNTKLTIYIIFKVFLVCLLPIIILSILYKNKSMARIIIMIKKQNKNFQQQIKELEQNNDDQEIEISSTGKSGNLKVSGRNILLIRSADNYIEVFFMENEEVEKKLIRNTLKNVESQILHNGNLIRCHRTSIVNIAYIEKLVRSYSGYHLILNSFDEKVPVSRQYLQIIKEVMK